MEEQKKTVYAIDVNLKSGASAGIAYYRLDDETYKFFKLVEEKHKIIGFEWDGSRNLGIIIGAE